MQAVFITKSSNPVQQSGKHRSFVGWVVMGPSVEVQIGMRGFVVYSVAQRAIGSPINICFQDGEMAQPFGLHSECTDGCC
jgi:hypothetical protein